MCVDLTDQLEFKAETRITINLFKSYHFQADTLKTSLK